MSRATAEVEFVIDGLVVFGLYNGTVDTMIPDLFRTPVERDVFWRQFNRKDGYHGDYKPCGCFGEACYISHTYGAGRVWEGKACREHLRLIGPLDPDPYY